MIENRIAKFAEPRHVVEARRHAAQIRTEAATMRSHIDRTLHLFQNGMTLALAVSVMSSVVHIVLIGPYGL